MRSVEDPVRVFGRAAPGAYGPRPMNLRRKQTPPATPLPDAERDRFQLQLGNLLEQIDDPDKLMKTALGQVAREMRAEGGAIYLRNPVTGGLRSIGWGRGAHWDGRKVWSFLEQERPELKASEIMAPIVSGRRAAGVMALARQSPFDPGAG